MINIQTIYEDESLIAFNKPKGLVVNKAESQKAEVLANYTEEILKIKKPKNLDKLTRDEQEFYSKQGIVHRLDKDTSGVIVVAKNPESYVKLKEQFLKQKVKKTYKCVVFNDVSHLFATHDYLKVDLPILRDFSNRTKFAINKEGRKAVTDFYLNTQFNGITISPVSTFEEFNFTFLTAKPLTGRTHQIRVHSKALNGEILGDTLYCGRKQIAFAKKHQFALMLHAQKLEILGHTFEAPYPKQFEEGIKKIWGV